MTDPDPAAQDEDVRWLHVAIERARRSVTEGGGPFAAVVVADGQLVADGVNRVTRDNDPTAHAEITALRAAGAVRGDFHLGGTVLYASCEPCPLCLAAALWARIDRLVFAADRHDAAAAGFDDAAFHALFAPRTDGWPFARVQRPVSIAVAPFEDWLAKTDRVTY